MAQQILVAGIGNPLRSDDAVGIEAVHELARKPLPTEVQAIVVESSILSLVCHAPAFDRLILVDALRPKDEPGRIYRFGEEEMTRYQTQLTSLHQMSILDVVALIKTENPSIAIRIVAMEIKHTGWGEKLSPCVARALPHMIRVIQEEIKQGVN